MRREGDNDKDNSDAKFAMMIMMTTIVLVMPSGQPQYVSTKECVLKVIRQFKYENRKENGDRDKAIKSTETRIFYLFYRT